MAPSTLKYQAGFSISNRSLDAVSNLATFPSTVLTTDLY